MQISLRMDLCLCKSKLIQLLMRNWKRIVEERLRDSETGRLSLSNMGISDKDIDVILEECKQIIKNVKVLSLQSNSIGPEGVKRLADGRLTNLTELWLWNNNIGAEGVKWLVNGHFSSLIELSLSQNNIGPEGVKYLTNGNFNNLSYLYLTNNNIPPVSKPSIRKLFSQMGQLQLYL